MNQYIIPPPDLPMFLHKNRPEYTLPQLITWANKEHRSRLRYCAKNGYYREWKRLNDDYSPIRVLAEMGGFRKICSYLINNLDGWNRLSRQERKFIESAYRLRDLLLR